MTWKIWPFLPTSLTDAIPNGKAGPTRDFIALVISGCSERLNRAITVIEAADVDSATIQLSSSDEIPLRRIDPVQPRQNCCPFCERFRQVAETDHLCQRQDYKAAKDVLARARRGQLQFERYNCHVGLEDYAGPIVVASRPVAVMLAGQFLPTNSLPNVMERTEKVLRHTYPALPDGELQQWLQDLHFAAGSSISRDEYSRRIGEASHHEDIPLNAIRSAAQEIERIAHGIWTAEKSVHERTFLDQVAHLCYMSGAPASRVALREKAAEILEKIASYCSLDYLLLFASDAEKISLKSQTSLLPLFAYSSPKSLTDRIEGIHHFNWRKARLGPESSHHTSKQPPRGIERILLKGAEPSPILGIKGPSSNRFADAIALVPVFLSERYRGAFLIGPSSSLPSEQLEQESSFFVELGRLVGGWLLNQLDAIDSEELSRSWNDVAQLLAHRVRGGLTPLRSSVEILDKYLRGDKGYSPQDADCAINSLNKAAQFLEMHLDLPLEAYAATAESTFAFVMTDIHSLVKDCVQGYLSAAQARGLSISLDPCFSSTVLAPVDPAQYALAVGYLLDNAIKYSHSDKEVVVSENVDSHTVQLCIDNFGLGIDKDDDELIYERQFRGKRSSRAEGAPGEGWGLFHARIIARAHGGDVTHICGSGDRAGRSKFLEGYRVRFFLTTSRTIEVNERKDSVSG